MNLDFIFHFSLKRELGVGLATGLDEGDHRPCLPPPPGKGSWF